MTAVDIAQRQAPPAVVNLPNALTLGRLLAVPLFGVLLLTGDSSRSLLAAAVFALACATDVLDGHLARRRDQVTDFGVLADPIADKALVGTALVGLSLLGTLPWWITVVVLGRELAVTAMRSALARHAVLPAGRGGKLKALTQNLAVLLYLLPFAALSELRLPVMLVAVVATVVTGLDYARQRMRLHGAGRAAG